MSEEKPLVGDDGAFYTGKLGTTEYAGDGTKTLHVLVGGAGATSGGSGMFVITAKAASGSIFPEKAKVGELYPALGSEVLADGDKLKKLELTHVADCTGWQLDITQSEIDVTRLVDQFKKYRLGKKDASGTVNSIMTLGVSDEAEGMERCTAQGLQLPHAPTTRRSEGLQCAVGVRRRGRRTLYRRGDGRDTRLRPSIPATITGVGDIALQRG